MIISIIALVIAISCSSKIKKLERENNSCKKAIGEILDVIDENPEFKKQIYENQTLMQHQKHIVAQNAIEQEIQTPHQTPTVQKMPIQQTTTPIVASSQPRTFTPIPNTKQQHKPIQTPVQTPKIPKENTNFENVFGKNVIGIVATILIFIGVIAFGTLVFTSFTDTIKVISMFIASFATVGVGLFFTKKNKTTFSEILTGCGMGMTYISLFISHLYFGIINDIATFVMIFLWSIGVSFTSKKFKINSLSYIALGGCIISSIFSLIYGFASQKFIEITIYHIITFILLIISNKENKALFKFSSFASIILNTILSGIIFTFIQSHNNNNLLILPFILAVYNTAIFLYSSKESLQDNIMDTVLSNIIHSISIFVTLCAPLSRVISDVILKNVVNHYDYHSIIFLPIVLIFVIISQILYNVFIKEKEKKILTFIFSEILFIIISLCSPLTIFNNSFMSFIPLIIINALFYKNMQKDNKISNVVYWCGFGILLFDCITSLFYLSNFALIGFIYSVLLIGLISIYMNIRYDNILYFPFAQQFLINTHFLFTSIIFAQQYNIDTTLTLLLIVLLNIAISGYCSFVLQNNNKISDILTETMESLLVFILSIVIIFTKETSPILSFILSISLIPLALIKIKTVIENKNPFMSVWYGIKFTFYLFMTTETFLRLSEQQFILSLFFMFIAAFCIIFGFKKELKPLRIYGLALIMASVFKMVVIDVWNQNSLIRVGSLIVGGIICFAISATYSKFEKKQQKNELIK